MTAHEAFARALEEAMRELEKDGDAFEDAASIRHRADQILKERSK